MVQNRKPNGAALFLWGGRKVRLCVFWNRAKKTKSVLILKIELRNSILPSLLLNLVKRIVQNMVWEYWRSPVDKRAKFVRLTD